MSSSNLSPRAARTGTTSYSPGAVLRQARAQRRWSQQRLIVEMEGVAQRLGLQLPQRDSLKAMVSRWEHDHRVPDNFNRRVLCAALGLDLSALGLPEDPDVPDLRS